MIYFENDMCSIVQLFAEYCKLLLVIICGVVFQHIYT